MTAVTAAAVLYPETQYLSASLQPQDGVWQNPETTVQLLNTRTGVRFAEGMFRIDYRCISMKR